MIAEIAEKRSYRRLIPRIAKAALTTAAVGAFLFVVWMFISTAFSSFPEYILTFAVLAWATIFFTFAVNVCEGTVYKCLFIIARAFFLIIYIAYATNYGTLNLKFEEFRFTVEFVPLLALMIVAELLSLASGILQALEFTSQSPRD
ncbi:MAG: hypothetical protein ACUVUF_00425 [Candidatus Bathycorpusculaceae bacterium]